MKRNLTRASVQKCEYFHKTYLKVEPDNTLKEYKGYCTNLMRPCAEVKKCYYKELLEARKNIKRLREQETYLKGCCTRCGKELEKYSFTYDSKEKNLVVQALGITKTLQYLKEKAALHKGYSPFAQVVFDEISNMENLEVKHE